MSERRVSPVAISAVVGLIVGTASELLADVVRSIGWDWAPAVITSPYMPIVVAVVTFAVLTWSSRRAGALVAFSPRVAQTSKW